MLKIAASSAAVALAGVMALVLFGTGSSPAARDDSASAPKYSHIQLRSFMAPVVAPGSSRTRMEPVTLIIEVEAAESEGMCNLTPRIQDAVTTELHRAPLVSAAEAGFDVGDAEPRLATVLNRAVGRAAIHRVYLIPGVRKLGEGTAARLPYAHLVGCKKI